MWQFTSPLEQGVIYQVSTPTDYFADLAGNNDTTAHALTFQVALESWDYRSRNDTDPFSVILVNGVAAGKLRRLGPAPQRVCGPVEYQPCRRQVSMDSAVHLSAAYRVISGLLFACLK